MISRTLIVRSTSLNPWRNLAIEEYLLDRVERDQAILYLWQNQNTVVIGKNQNAWRECRTERLESEGGKLARRLSGGGAVFHDTGNLNFTFLAGRENYDLQRQVGVILAAVRSLGIEAEMSGRNDLTVDGRKFSGNAFCFRGAGAYHHGTILVSVDFSKLAGYLQVSGEKIRSKGIQSVQSRVVNLCEYRPSLSIEEMADALREAFRLAYGGGRTPETGTEDMDGAVLASLEEKYASWEWRYGEAPKFDMDLDTRFDWGGLEIGLRLENGRIASASVFSDAMDEAYISALPGILKGCLLKSSEIAARIRSIEGGPENGRMTEDIAAWLEAKGF
jgi:lipoate-protein ligase A